MPVIDWTEIDEQDSRSKKSALVASAQKASWLQRFLLHMGTDDAMPHDHDIEVASAAAEASRGPRKVGIRPRSNRLSQCSAQ